MVVVAISTGTAGQVKVGCHHCRATSCAMAVKGVMVIVKLLLRDGSSGQRCWCVCNAGVSVKGPL